MKILVTGGAGYIGSHACKALAAKGHLPITLDNLSRGNAWAVKWGPLVCADVADAQRVRATLDKYEPDAVMHFAAFAYVGESVALPHLYYQNNSGGSASLLSTLCEWRPIPVVFSSTCATYGIPEQIPISEEHPQSPINPYGWSKLFTERMLADTGHAVGLPWVGLRYFNAAGADPEGQIGEAHEPETHLIPLILRAAQSGEPVTIFGGDYDTADGTCVRDYIHVADIANAHLRALDYLVRGGPSRAFNLANARGHSVRQVIATAEQVTGRLIRVRISPRRPGDPAILIGDATQARNLLGWAPELSELATQIADAWRWHTRAPGAASR